LHSKSVCKHPIAFSNVSEGEVNALICFCCAYHVQSIEEFWKFFMLILALSWLPLPLSDLHFVPKTFWHQTAILAAIAVA
ncbi:hypothetical protein, partial [Novosphingobium pentaromativorans]|uniref:hypothetical protein n=1 Tax=Novosphingobium pentaromativorans TaxID=205844 RepID=UPI001EE654BD